MATRLPETPQPTGQLTCSSITDVSTFPKNTSYLFKNIFDSRLNFDTVEYLALSTVTFTTPPPAPPPTIVSVGTADPLTFSFVLPLILGFTTNVPSLAPLPGDTLSVIFGADVPQIGIGEQLLTDEDKQALFTLYQETWDGAITTIADGGSLSNKIVPTFNTAAVTVNNVFALSSGYLANNPDHAWPDNAPPTLSELGFKEFNMPPQNLTLTSALGTADVVSLFPSITFPTVGKIGLALFFDSVNPITVTTTLQATMSDASVVPFATISLKCDLRDCSTVLNYPNIGNKTLLTMLNYPIATPSPQTVPIFPKVGFENGEVLIPGVGVICPGLTCFASHTSSSVGFQGSFAEGSLTMSLIPSLYSGAGVREWIPIERPIFDRPKKRMKLLGTYAAPIPTYDNILQILCDQLEVDRLAGSAAAQILAVVPFDFSQLASGFYKIDIPINSLVWRKISDINIKDITFQLANGIGEVPSYLDTSQYVVTLGLRFI